jgi:lysophospholipid acyltransferase (LPLAT)-like uncharacterized protein
MSNHTSIRLKDEKVLRRLAADLGLYATRGSSASRNVGSISQLLDAIADGRLLVIQHDLDTTEELLSTAIYIERMSAKKNCIIPHLLGALADELNRAARCGRRRFSDQT